ncbi:MAG: hypothetical protein LBH68_01135 [Bifidobacteriaceae bacterium]|jgi:DNA-binding response OmpR family regulator|nr:hypothetical protein [Bifidobacteriaceae bacterium]
MTVTVPDSSAVQPLGSGAAKILLYSDNAAVRAEIKDCVGDTVGAASRPVQWTEVATYQMAMIKCQAETYDLIVMDNETGKLGGVGLVREMRNELDWQPVVLLVLARQQDAWLGAWSGADAAVLQPVDPFQLRALVAKLLGISEA